MTGKEAFIVLPLLCLPLFLFWQVSIIDRWVGKLQYLVSSTDKTLHYSHRRLAYILGSIYFDWVDLSTSLASHTYVLKAPTLPRFLCVHAIVYETNKPRFPLGHVWIIDNGSILSCDTVYLVQCHHILKFSSQDRCNDDNSLSYSDRNLYCVHEEQISE